MDTGTWVKFRSFALFVLAKDSRKYRLADFFTSCKFSPTSCQCQIWMTLSRPLAMLLTLTLSIQYPTSTHEPLKSWCQCDQWETSCVEWATMCDTMERPCMRVRCVCTETTIARTILICPTHSLWETVSCQILIMRWSLMMIVLLEGTTTTCFVIFFKPTTIAFVVPIVSWLRHNGQYWYGWYNHCCHLDTVLGLGLVRKLLSLEVSD